MSGPLRIGALISGGGRTLLNIADTIDAGTLAAEVAVVISSRHDAAGVDRARARGFEVRVAARVDFATEDDLHDAIDAWLREAGVDLVCACGYLRLIRVEAWLVGRALNIHPALLPDFGGPGMYGLRVHRAVLDARRSESGCTVHFIDEAYDHGPTIVQRRCPVLREDTPETLAARVFEQECLAYPEGIRLLIERRVRLVGDRVERP